MTKGKFYVTTAIDYVNASPHIGTAYEKIAADFLARSRRLAGYDVRFLMGNDEHSINVAREAASRGLAPIAYCDQMEGRFRSVWEHLNISFDDFIRTTQPRHQRAVQALFAAVHAAGDIYKGTYKGYYCDPARPSSRRRISSTASARSTRPSRAGSRRRTTSSPCSRFGDRLQRHILENPEFVQPDIRRNELLRVIEGGLEDISVSRSGAEWGIPLSRSTPSTVYVWFDALINYISALGWPDDPAGLFKRYWSCDLHIIGKDITRFHCLIWPAMHVCFFRREEISGDAAW